MHSILAAPASDSPGATYLSSVIFLWLQRHFLAFRCGGFSPQAPRSDRFFAPRHGTRAHARACSINTKIKWHNEQNQRCNGYAVHPTSHRLPDGSFSSNLQIEGVAGRYEFYCACLLL
ncbi:hypothetical protein EFP18_24525 [Burkholderia glumae]|uniref:hypothetical protein n=1 Tax=Burkholderia glumae TaxID=337 RepID=UPI000F5E77F8|nr:hypothetical protein [Burkholderia glumae]MCQ0029700.1 hypothetical protein [Burkholderia glumae]MCQ0037318.1 hypothetical protein [Burkholderia glumae]QJW77315.1 hypothetical protein GAS18_01730 [Burkholderia glumae]RQZ73429.1 hypothetical protein DF052_12085 [Burkholderia glumae]UVS87231.1 hypothetical protein EFP18_24525 [Burkholderia glumae]